jgi:DNA invertase Pin-like site-specific DNA recombinase
MSAPPDCFILGHHDGRGKPRGKLLRVASQTHTALAKFHWRCTAQVHCAGALAACRTQLVLLRPFLSGLAGRGRDLAAHPSNGTTAGNMGRMVITVLGMVADMELKFIRDRQRAGIDAAKGKGVYKGRQKRVDDDEIQKLASEGVTKAKIARDLGVSRMTVYRALNAKKGKADLGAASS